MINKTLKKLRNLKKKIIKQEKVFMEKSCKTVGKFWKFRTKIPQKLDQLQGKGVDATVIR